MQVFECKRNLCCVKPHPALRKRLHLLKVEKKLPSRTEIGEEVKSVWCLKGEA
jgi:hypothetical protein